MKNDMPLTKASEAAHTARFALERDRDYDSVIVLALSAIQHVQLAVSLGLHSFTRADALKAIELAESLGMRAIMQQTPPRH